MDFLGITPAECKSAFAAGDMAYYNAQGCTETAAIDQLLAAKKSEINFKTWALVGGGVLVAGIVIYLSVKKTK